MVEFGDDGAVGGDGFGLFEECCGGGVFEVDGGLVLVEFEQGERTAFVQADGLVGVGQDSDGDVWSYCQAEEVVGLVGHHGVAGAGVGEGVVGEVDPHAGWAVGAVEDVLALGGGGDSFLDLVVGDGRVGGQYGSGVVGDAEQVGYQGGGKAGDAGGVGFAVGQRREEGGWPGAVVLAPGLVVAERGVCEQLVADRAGHPAQREEGRHVFGGRGAFAAE